jgi:hypothetical protein
VLAVHFSEWPPCVYPLQVAACRAFKEDSSVQELLNQFQSPAWWIAAAITGVVGNLAWALLTRLYPPAVRNAVPVARVMVCAYAAAIVLCVVYVAAVAPAEWTLMQLRGPDAPIDRVMFVVVVTLSAVAFPCLVALFGPPSGPLVLATVLSCWTAFAVYLTATYQPSNPATDQLLVGAYFYSFLGSALALLISVPFMPFAARNIARQQDRKIGGAA